MKDSVTNKIFSLILALVILLPIALKLHHALEDHHTEFCYATDVQHIHKFKVSCAHFHFFNTITYEKNSLNFILNKPVRFIRQFFSLHFFYFPASVSSFSDRAPPAILS